MVELAPNSAPTVALGGGTRAFVALVDGSAACPYEGQGRQRDAAAVQREKIKAMWDSEYDSRK